MNLLTVEHYDELIDCNKILREQWEDFRKACFHPYITNSQFIKYLCEQCSDAGKYRYCDFYEKTHLRRFENDIKEIKKDKTILKPVRFPPKAERFCYEYTDLLDILKNEFELFKHDLIEPDDRNFELYWAWKRKRKKILQKHPCETSDEKRICNFKPYCPFNQNNFPRLLATDDIIYDKDKGKFVLENKSGKTPDGHYIHSRLYKLLKNKIKPDKVIGSDEEKRVDEKHYEIYEKIFNIQKNEKKQSFYMFNFQINLMLEDKLWKPEDLLNTYVIIRKIYLTQAEPINESVINKYADEYDLDVDNPKKALERLEELKMIKKSKNNYILDTSYAMDYDNMKSLFHNNHELVTLSLKEIERIKLIKVNLPLMLSYKKFLNENIYNIFYEYFLSNNKIISRREITNRLNISRPTQIEIEKNLYVRKIWRNHENKKISINKIDMSGNKREKRQAANEFKVNKYTVENIFSLGERSQLPMGLRPIGLSSDAQRKS